MRLHQIVHPSSTGHGFFCQNSVVWAEEVSAGNMGETLRGETVPQPSASYVGHVSRQRRIVPGIERTSAWSEGGLVFDFGLRLCAMR